MRCERIILITLLLGALCAAPAHALRVITEESPPSSFTRDGVLTGASVDMVREIMRRAGDAAEIVSMPWARGYMMLREEPDIALFAVSRTQEREKLFSWVGPLLRVKWVLYAKKDSGIRVRSLDDARKVGSIGTYRDDAREQYLRREGFTNLQSVSSNAINVRKLLAGRIDLMVSSNLGVAGIAREAGAAAEDLEEVFVLRPIDLYIAFSRGVDPALPARWQTALQTMRRDGTYAAIHENWFPGQMPP